MPSLLLTASNENRHQSAICGLHKIINTSNHKFTSHGGTITVYLYLGLNMICVFWWAICLCGKKYNKFDQHVDANN